MGLLDNVDPNVRQDLFVEPGHETSTTPAKEVMIGVALPLAELAIGKLVDWLHKKLLHRHTVRTDNERRP